jgi:hypothetical protein
VQFFFQCALFQYPFLNPKPCTPCLSPTLKHNPLNTKPPTVQKKNASCTKETKTPVISVLHMIYITNNTELYVCVYAVMYMMYITNNTELCDVCVYVYMMVCI